MTAAERRWCLALAAVLAVLTSIPYAVGLQAQGESWVFTGFVFGVEDGNSYIAKMLQGAQGAWLFRTPYSSQDSAPILAFLPYLLLGKLAAGNEVHLQLVVLFHLFRLVLIPAAVLAVYRFVSRFLEDVGGRRWATALVTAGGGLGWLLVLIGREHLLGSLPLDLYSPETFGFLAFYGLPHLLLAKSLLLLGLTVILDRPAERRAGVTAGLLFLLAGLAQPLTVISGYAALGAFLLAGAFARHRPGEPRAMAWQAGAWAVATSMPVVVYYGLGAFLDPALRQWTAQNVLTSPHPVHYLIAYGLVLIPAVVGALRMVRGADVRGQSIVVWLVVLLAMAYLPVPVQRRLVDGAWVALAILAAKGLGLASDAAVRWRPAVAILTLSLGTSVLLVAGGTWSALRPGAPAYRPAHEIRAIGALGEVAEPGSVVLASFDSGNVLPAFLPVHSVVGHGPETANLQELLPQVEAFFGPEMTDGQRLSFLDDQDVDYVFYGPLERMGGGWGARTPLFLDEIGSQGAYFLYEVADR